MVTATGPRRTDSSAFIFPPSKTRWPSSPAPRWARGQRPPSCSPRPAPTWSSPPSTTMPGGASWPISNEAAAPPLPPSRRVRLAQVRGLIAATAAHCGRLDVAVNNAAIRPDNKPLAELDEYCGSRHRSQPQGVALCLKWELQQMIRHGGHGSIINISSVSGIRPQAAASAYVAAKHGVIGLTKVAAVENGHLNIRVNAVAPGAIDTPMLQGGLARTNRTGDDVAPHFSLFNRLGLPREIAQASLGSRPTTPRT